MIKNIKVAFIEPRYQINLGYEARVLKNFEIRRMYLINPKCKFNGKNAIKYSKHASDLIKNAAILKDLKSVTRNSFVVGTTALWRKSRKHFDNVMTLPDFEEYISGKGIENMTLLIGRDNTGLNSEELFQCNSIVFIPTSQRYPTLNISHALAILLYALTAQKPSSLAEEISKLYAGSSDLRMINSLFGASVDSNPYIRKKETVKKAFENVLVRANPTKKEINALTAAFSKKYKA